MFLLERRFGSHEEAARAIVLKDKTQLAGTSIVIKVNWSTGATGAAASASASTAVSAATFSVAPSSSASSSATSTPSKSTVAALPVLPASLCGLSALEPSYLAALLKLGGLGVPGLQLPPISQALPAYIPQAQAQAALAAQLSALQFGAVPSVPLSRVPANCVGFGVLSPVTTNLNMLNLSQLLGQTAAATAPVPAPSSADLTAANSAALLTGIPPAVLMQLYQSLLAGAQLPSRAGAASLSPAPAIARQQQHQSATLQASSALVAASNRQLLQTGIYNNLTAPTSSSSAQTLLANAQMAALQGSQPPKPPAPQSQPQPQITFSSPPVLRISNAHPNPNPNTAPSKHVAHVSTAFPTVSASAPAAHGTPSSVPQTNSSDSGLSPDQNPPLHLSPDEPVLKQHRLSARCSLQSQPQPQSLAAAALNGARLVAMQQQRTPPSSTFATVYSSEPASTQQTSALVSPSYTGDSSPSEAAADVIPVAVPAVSLQQHHHQLTSSLPVHKYSLAAGLPAVSASQAFSQMLLQQQQNNQAVLAAAADGACRATGSGASGDSLALFRAQLALLGACSQAQASTAMPVGVRAGAGGSSSVSPLLLVPVGAPASQTPAAASAAALSRLPTQQQLLFPGTAAGQATMPNLLSGFGVGGPANASAAGGVFSLFGLPPNAAAGGFLSGASLPALGGLSVPSAMLRPPAFNLMGLGAGSNASPAGAFSALQTLQALQLLSAPNSLHL